MKKAILATILAGLALSGCATQSVPLPIYSSSDNRHNIYTGAIPIDEEEAVEQVESPITFVKEQDYKASIIEMAKGLGQSSKKAKTNVKKTNSSNTTTNYL